MSFSAQVGHGGLSGWSHVRRTEKAQKIALSQDPGVRRSKDYFLSKIKGANDYSDIIGDFRLLKIVLGANRLDVDMRNKAYISKVLNSDLSDSKSLVNRLADKSYKRLAQSVAGLWQNGALDMSAASDLFDRYVDSQFEVSVGQKDNSIRLALSARRDVDVLMKDLGGDTAKWYSVLGSKSLRTFFEGVLGTKGWLTNLPIDRQLELLTTGMEQKFGVKGFASFGDPALFDRLATRFFLNEKLSSVKRDLKSHILLLFK